MEREIAALTIEIQTKAVHKDSLTLDCKALQDTVRLGNQDVIAQEKMLDSLLRKRRKRAEERTTKISRLRSIVTDGELSMAAAMLDTQRVGARQLSALLIELELPLEEG
eukprot:gene1486-1709_t